MYKIIKKTKEQKNNERNSNNRKRKLGNSTCNPLKQNAEIK